jgi:hypothetical protein
MPEETKHVPYNTAPMSFEEREKELAKSGSRTPLKQDEPKSKRKSTEELESKKKKKGKSKAPMGGGSDPT